MNCRGRGSASQRCWERCGDLVTLHPGEAAGNVAKVRERSGDSGIKPSARRATSSERRILNLLAEVAPLACKFSNLGNFLLDSGKQCRTFRIEVGVKGALQTGY